MPDTFFPPKPDIEPKIYAYRDKSPAYDGLLKVGFTARDVEGRVAQQYLSCLGGDLTDRHTAQRALKKIGRPTMLVCEVPLAMIRRSYIEDFAGKMLAQLFQELAGEEETEISMGVGGFSLTSDLPPESIVGHYHPEKVFDPYRGR